MLAAPLSQGHAKYQSLVLSFTPFLLQGRLLAQYNTLLGLKQLQELSTALLADRAENETLSFQIQHVAHLTPKRSEKHLYSFCWQKKCPNSGFEGC